MEPLRLRSLRPERRVFDSGDQHWRGAVVTAVGASITIRYLADGSFVRTAVVALALVPVDARSVGCPVAVRVTGGGADSYTIVEVVGSHAGADAVSDAAAAVARGDYRYGVVPRSITNEPLVWWEG